MPINKARMNYVFEAFPFFHMSIQPIANSWETMHKIWYIKFYYIVEIMSDVKVFLWNKICPTPRWFCFFGCPICSFKAPQTDAGLCFRALFVLIFLSWNITWLTCYFSWGCTLYLKNCRTAELGTAPDLHKTLQCVDADVPANTRLEANYIWRMFSSSSGHPVYWMMGK